MKGKVRRQLVLLLAMAMIAVLFAGCSGKSNNSSSSSGSSNTPEQSQAAAPESSEAAEPSDSAPAIDTSKQVELSMYLVGEMPSGFETMNAELNKMLLRDINATIKFNFLTWGEYEQKYPLILSTGEPFDLIYSASWIQFGNQAQKGGFMALDDLLPKYAPKLDAELTQVAKDQSKVNGKIYMIPSTDVGVNGDGVMVRGDLMKKFNIPDIKTYDDLEFYYDTIKKNVPGLLPLNLAGNRAEIAGLTAMIKPENTLWGGGFGLGLNILGDENNPTDIFNLYFTPEYEAYAKKMKTWADKGYWSKSVLSNKVGAGDAFKNGTSAAAGSNLGDANAKYLSIMQEHPEWEPRFYPMNPDKPVFKDVYTGNGVSIGANSPNPERAIMFIELANTREEYHDLLYYGIKGTNYQVTADNRLESVEGNPMYSGEDVSIWGFSNAKFTKLPKDLMPGYTDILELYDKTAVDSVYAGFVFNNENVKSELAALANVRDQYAAPLSTGMVSNVDDALATLRKQLQIAGIDKVVAEVKSQVEAFLANR